MKNAKAYKQIVRKLPPACLEIIAAYSSLLALRSSLILLSSSVLTFVAAIESTMDIRFASLRVFTARRVQRTNIIEWEVNFHNSCTILVKEPLLTENKTAECLL